MLLTNRAIGDGRTGGVRRGTIACNLGLGTKLAFDRGGDFVVWAVSDRHLGR
jgi:hypothetical protein